MFEWWIIQKILKKNIFFHFFRDVLILSAYPTIIACQAIMLPGSPQGISTTIVLPKGGLLGYNVYFFTFLGSCWASFFLFWPATFSSSSFHLFASTTLAATVQAFLPCLADIATYTIDRKPQTNTQTIKHKQTNKLSAKTNCIYGSVSYHFGPFGCNTFRI